MATRRTKPTTATQPQRALPPPEQWPQWLLWPPAETDPRAGMFDPAACEAASAAMRRWTIRCALWFTDNRPDLANDPRTRGEMLRAEQRRRASSA